MDLGVVWADPETARQFEFKGVPKFANVKHPLFYTRLSYDVAQEPNTDKLTVESNLPKAPKGLGVANPSVQKFHWGTYPVLSISGKRKNGETVCCAWVGLNTKSGWTLVIVYHVPDGDGHPTKDETGIWSRFLAETK